jgi:hypothetical protein
MDPAVRLLAIRARFARQVRDALAEVPPEVAESAVGQAALAGALVEAAAELLAEQADPAFARRVLAGLVQRWRPTGGAG